MLQTESDRLRRRKYRKLRASIAWTRYQPLITRVKAEIVEARKRVEATRPPAFGPERAYEERVAHHSAIDHWRYLENTLIALYGARSRAAYEGTGGT